MMSPRHAPVLWLCVAMTLLAGLFAAGAASAVSPGRTAKAPSSTPRVVTHKAAKPLAAKRCTAPRRGATTRPSRRTCRPLRRSTFRTSPIRDGVKASAAKARPQRRVKAPAQAPGPAPAPAPEPAPAPTDPAPTPQPSPVPTAPVDVPADTRMYSATSPFNVPIGATPRLAPNSPAMVAKSLLPYTGNANFAYSDWWGISIVHARPSDPLQQVAVFDWGWGADIAQPSVRVPDGAPPTLGSDRHLAVIDGARELDMWVTWQQADGSWKAGTRAVSSITGSGVAAPIAGNAAGFALAAGIIRPEEIARGRIDHALQFTSPYVLNRFVAPAVHTDGRQSDPDAMPMGTRIQLDPAADISALPSTQRLVAQALKEYGAYLSDSSGSLAIRGEASLGRASQGGPADIWSPVGVTDPTLRAIPWDKMRVVLP